MSSRDDRSSDGLRWKPHLACHVLSPREVALAGQDEAHVLVGAAYAALARLLDGALDEDALAAQLRGRVPAAEVYYALMRLEKAGFIERAAPMPADVAEAGWWSQQALSAGAAGAGVGQGGVCVAWDEGSARAAGALERLLAGRFEIAGDGAAAMIVLTTDYLDPAFQARIAQSAGRSRIVLPARIGGRDLWIGPQIRDGRTEVFDVLARRLAANRPYRKVIAEAGGAGMVAPPVALPETDALAAAILCNVLLASLADRGPEALERAVLTLDPWTLASRTHVVAAAAAPGVAPASGDGAVTLAPCPRLPADGGYRSCPPEETLQRLSPLVSPLSGIVPAIERQPAPAGMTVYTALQVLDLGTATRTDPRTNRILGKPSGAAGKGATDVQAQVSCLAEAVERYSCCFAPDLPRRSGRLGAFGEPMLPPGDLMLFSERQYQRRATLNEGRSGFNWTPERFDPSRPIDWTPAWSLSRMRRVWLPAAYCYFGFRDADAPDFCRADSNGCASGNTLEEAILQGLLELIERDACAIWWYNRTRCPGADLAGSPNPFIARMCDQYASAGRTLTALDLTSDLGIPVFMAVSARRQAGDRIHMALGCHLDPDIALSRAVAELNQVAFAEFAAGSGPHAPQDPDHARWLAGATLADHPYLMPREGSGISLPAAGAGAPSGDLRDDVMSLVARLDRLGHETIVLDCTRPDVGFPVARVVVPGLRHFWARFAPGRLYDVPVKLRLLPEALPEAQLNPVPFFL